MHWRLLSRTESHWRSNTDFKKEERTTTIPGHTPEIKDWRLLSRVESHWRSNIVFRLERTKRVTELAFSQLTKSKTKKRSYYKTNKRSHDN